MSRNRETNVSITAESHLLYLHVLSEMDVNTLAEANLQSINQITDKLNHFPCLSEPKMLLIIGSIPFFLQLKAHYLITV